MADSERGRDRVRRGGANIDRHLCRQRVIAASLAPEDGGPVLHRGGEFAEASRSVNSGKSRSKAATCSGPGEAVL